MQIKYEKEFDHHYISILILIQEIQNKTDF